MSFNSKDLISFNPKVYNTGFGLVSNIQKLLPNETAKSLKKIIDLPLKDGRSIRCLYEGGIVNGKFDGDCTVKSYESFSLGKTSEAQIPRERLFLKGEFSKGIISGQGQMYDLFGTRLYDGYFINGKPNGVAKVCAEAPVYKQNFSSGLYIGNVSESIPEGNGVMCVPMEKLFNTYFLDSVNVSLAADYSSSYDVRLKFEEYLYRHLIGDSSLKNRTITTRDSNDSILLQNAMSRRSEVENICNVKIPVNFYPMYVGGFKNGMFDGQGFLITGDFQSAYAGRFRQSTFEKAENISLRTIGRIF